MVRVLIIGFAGKHYVVCARGNWRGTGRRESGRKGDQRRKGGGSRGAGIDIPKEVGSRRNRGKVRNITQYFVIEKVQKGGNQQK